MRWARQHGPRDRGCRAASSRRSPPTWRAPRARRSTCSTSTPEPDAEDPDLRRYVEDRSGLKGELAARMKERGERPTPVAIEKELARFERLAAALAAIEAVREAGGTVHYHAVDLTDADGGRAVLDEVRGVDGPASTCVVHAAGVEVSRALPDKEPREFDLVHDVKADGWFNVLYGRRRPAHRRHGGVLLGGRPVRQRRPDRLRAPPTTCCARSPAASAAPGPTPARSPLDWTAWGGIGMATRGSIPQDHGDGRGGDAAAGGRRRLDPPRARPAHAFRGRGGGGRARWAGWPRAYHPTGGLDPASGRRAARRADGRARSVAADVLDGLVVRTTLDPAEQPFLDDHRIDGTPVLPGVMGMEAFAEVAAAARARAGRSWRSRTSTSWRR